MTKTLIVNRYTISSLLIKESMCTNYIIPHSFHTAKRGFIVLFSKRGSPYEVTFENKKMRHFKYVFELLNLIHLVNVENKCSLKEYDHKR